MRIPFALLVIPTVYVRVELSDVTVSPLLRLPATEMAYDVAGLPRPGCFGHAPPVSDASSNVDTSCAPGVKSRCMWPDAPARGRAWAAVRTSCCGTCCWPLLRACGCACMTTSQGFTAHASAPRRLFCDLCGPNAPLLLFWGCVGAGHRRAESTDRPFQTACNSCGASHARAKCWTAWTTRAAATPP